MDEKMSIEIIKSCWQRNPELPFILAIGTGAKNFQNEVKKHKGPGVITFEALSKNLATWLELGDVSEANVTKYDFTSIVAVVVFDGVDPDLEMDDWNVAVIKVTGEPETKVIIKRVKEACTPPPIKIVGYGDHTNLKILKYFLDAHGHAFAVSTDVEDTCKWISENMYDIVVVYDNGRSDVNQLVEACKNAKIPVAVFFDSGEKSFGLLVKSISAIGITDLIEWVTEQIDKLIKGFPTYEIPFLNDPSGLSQKKKDSLLDQIRKLIEENKHNLNGDDVDSFMAGNRLTILIS